MKDQHLISVDELRAAGALDVPAAWRKSLGGPRDQLTLFGDDDTLPEKQQAAPREPGDNGSADERQSAASPIRHDGTATN